MRIHEHTAKKIFQGEGIPVPSSQLVKTPQEAEKAAKNIGKPVALKAQVLVGGRGKAGGIKLVDDLSQVCETAEELFRSKIKGEPVKKLLVEEKLDIKSEFYVSISMDRSARKPIVMASMNGGMDIEELARENPDKIVKYYINPLEEFLPYQAREIARKMGVESSIIPKVGSIIFDLFKVFKKYDATIAEINPLVYTDEGIMAADAKLIIDDDAFYRQKKIAKIENIPKDEFAYVKLPGNIAVIGNGAGLTLSGMDMLKLFGGEPATFLDIGGGASEENISRAMELVISNEHVKVVFLNVLGGITRADDVARGVLNVLKASERDVPIVIRLTGTNEDEGQRILAEAGLSFETSMEEAAKKAVNICNSMG